MKRWLYILLGICILIITIGTLYFLSRPQFELIGEEKVTVLLNTSYQELGAKVTIPVSKKSPKVKITGEVDVTKVGIYYIEYSFTYHGKTYKKEREVNVKEEEAPLIVLNGGLQVYLCPNQIYEEQGYEAKDNYDGDLTHQVQIEKNENNWLYSVEDSSHNSFQITREFIHEDNESPVLTLSGQEIVTIYLNETYYEPGYQAYDNCDGDLSNKVRISGKVNTTVKGVYELKYTVEDTSGHITEATRIVKVVPVPSDNGKIIYLTFDDGPSSTITPGVLQILKEENVKATFFVINHSDSLNYLIKQAYDDGHTIAIHSYTHNYRQIYSSEANYFDDLKLMENKIINITGKKPTIIRFPGGSSNTVSKFNPGIMTRLAKEVTSQGYTYFDWNVGSGDAGGVSSAEEVYQNVVQSLGNKNNVVLMHDFEGNYYTLNALRRIIEYGKNNGYTFAAITESTPQIKHKIAN